MRRQHFSGLLLPLLLAACKHPKQLQKPPASVASAATPGAASSALRAPPESGAFDLTSFDGGAVLAVANGTALTLSWFDEAGKATQAQNVALASADAGGAQPTIAEVAAVADGAELALAWIESSGNQAHARGLVRGIAGDNRGPIVDLGAVQTPLSVPRGNLALASSDGHFSVLARGAKTPCIEPTENDCVGFAFLRLEASGKSPQGLPLTVPLPCEENSVSFAVAGTRRYYGVCSRATGKPITTLFSIQTEPEYARADRILEGCLPEGALSIDGELVVVGNCAGERRAVRIRRGNADPEEVRVERLDASCQAGLPLIRQIGVGGLHLTLSGRRDRLEAFLPDALRLPRARAVWTGQTLLVAGLVGRSITLKGYQCDSTLLREVQLGRGVPSPPSSAR